MRSPVTTSHYPLTTHTPLNTRQTSHRSSDDGKVSHSPPEEGGPPPETGGGGGQPGPGELGGGVGGVGSVGIVSSTVVGCW